MFKFLSDTEEMGSEEMGSGHDVVTAFEDGTSEMNDSELLNRASELGLVLFTQDDDLLVEAATRQKDGGLFNGVIYAHQLRISIGACINDLEIITKAAEPKRFDQRSHIPPS